MTDLIGGPVLILFPQTKQVARGLLYLHNNGIIHGDIQAVGPKESIPALRVEITYSVLEQYSCRRLRQCSTL